MAPRLLELPRVAIRQAAVVVATAGTAARGLAADLTVLMNEAVVELAEDRQRDIGAEQEPVQEEALDLGRAKNKPGVCRWTVVFKSNETEQK